MASRILLPRLNHIYRLATSKNLSTSVRLNQPRGGLSRDRSAILANDETLLHDDFYIHRKMAKRKPSVNSSLTDDPSEIVKITTDDPTEIISSEVVTNEYGQNLMPSLSGAILDLSEKEVVSVMEEQSKEAQTYYKLFMDSQDVGEVLEFVSRHHKVLNKVHYALAMKRLSRELRQMDAVQADMFKESLKDNPQFQVLCALLGLKAPHYEGQIAADMTVFMSHLGLDSQHPTIQVYLQLLKYHINDLHLEELARLSFCLVSMTASKQTTLLLHAIGILCNHRNKDFETLNIWQLVTLLEIHSQTLDDETAIILMENVLENISSLSLRHAIIALHGLAKMGIKERMNNKDVICAARDLMNCCIERVLPKIDSLDYEDILGLLNSCLDMGVYDHALFVKAGDKVLLDYNIGNNDNVRVKEGTDNSNLTLNEADKNGNLEFKDILDVLKVLCKLGHHHKGLVNALKKGLHQDMVQWCRTEVLVDILEVVSEFAAPDDIMRSDNMPDWLVALVRGIESNWQQIDKDHHARCLLNLALWGQSSVVKVLGFDGLNMMGSKAFPTRHHLEFILAKISGHQISTPGVICRTEDAEECGRALVLALGKHHVYTPNTTVADLPIDHLVFLNRDGSLSTKFDPVTGDPTSEDVQRVAVLVLGSNSFHGNTQQLRGGCLLWARMLQDAGLAVSVINYDEWKKVQDRDMLLWLRRKILNTPNEQRLLMLPV